jgi:hypothetical protein
LDVFKNCDLIGFDKKRFGRWIAKPGGLASLTIHRYRILGQAVIGTFDIPDAAFDTKVRPWRNGDVAVRVEWFSCTATDRCIVESREDPKREFGEGCPRSECVHHVTIYIMRKKGAVWTYVDTFDEPDYR